MKGLSNCKLVWHYVLQLIVIYLLGDSVHWYPCADILTACIWLKIIKKRPTNNNNLRELKVWKSTTKETYSLVNACWFQVSATRHCNARILDNILKISILFMIMLICPITSEPLTGWGLGLWRHITVQPPELNLRLCTSNASRLISYALQWPTEPVSVVKTAP